MLTSSDVRVRFILSIMVIHRDITDMGRFCASFIVINDIHPVVCYPPSNCGVKLNAFVFGKKEV